MSLDESSCSKGSNVVVRRLQTCPSDRSGIDRCTLGFTLSPSIDTCPSCAVSSAKLSAHRWVRLARHHFANHSGQDLLKYFEQYPSGNPRGLRL